MYTVTESTKRNDEYFDFVKELDSIKGRRLKCSGGCEICSRGGNPPPEYAPDHTCIRYGLSVYYFIPKYRVHLYTSECTF